MYHKNIAQYFFQGFLGYVIFFANIAMPHNADFLVIEHFILFTSVVQLECSRFKGKNGKHLKD